MKSISASGTYTGALKIVGHSLTYPTCAWKPSCSDREATPTRKLFLDPRSREKLGTLIWGTTITGLSMHMAAVPKRIGTLPGRVWQPTAGRLLWTTIVDPYTVV